MRSVWEIREEFRPDLLVLDSTFLSYRKVARQIMAKSWWTWIFQPATWLVLSDDWAPGDRLSDLKGVPVIVIHSRTDEIVPFELGEEVFKSAAEPKNFWVKEYGIHIATYEGELGETFKKKLLGQLSQLLKEPNRY